MVDQQNSPPPIGRQERRYELSWTWLSAAMGCHTALEEIGSGYVLRFIDFEKPWPVDDFALNPNQKVPTLVDRSPQQTGMKPTHGPAGHTVVIYQSAAILLYLADNHPESGLIPTLGSAARGHCYQWLFFMAEMLQPSYHMFYYPERHTTQDDAASHQAVQSRAIAWIDDIWQRLDRAVGKGAYFLGDEFSVCDLYMLPMASWNESDRQFASMDGYSNLSRILSNIRSRPSVQRMIAAHTTG